MKATPQSLYKSLNILLVVLLAGLGGGCDTIQDHSLTYALWSDSRDTSHCRSQTDPQLRLFDSEHPPDVLVEYNAVGDWRKGVQRRAYFLNASSKRIAAGKPPRFVNARRDAGFTPIAVLKSVPPPNSPAFTNVVFAICQGTTFTLYRPESSPEFCALPNYQDGIVINSWKRAALTPSALVVDAVVDVTIIGVVAGVVAGYAYCGGAGTVSP
jgi:hypothetical protein